MAKETKVGLLVGLAFIICFAIILANRGRQEQIATQLPYSLLVDRSTESSAQPQKGIGEESATSAPLSRKTAHRSTADFAGKPAAGGATTLARVPGASNGAGSYRPDVDGGPHAGITGGVELGSTSALTSSEAARGPFGGRPVYTQRDPAEARAKPTSSTPTIAEQSRKLQELLNKASDRARGQDSQARSLPTMLSANGGERRRLSAARVPARRAERARGRYVVAAGDTLYGIAAQAYGTGSRTVIEAIYDANRSVLSNINELKVGDELILPAIEGIDRPKSGTTKSTATRRRTPTRPDRRKDTGRLAWYQVKKGDRYSSIAREQLGDTARWKEIYELNRDKFPDPDRIREGVRIKMPSKRKPSVSRKER